MENTGKLAGLTVFITGGSRGIGKEIAIKIAKDGANVVIAAKTTTPHPKLPGTIYSAIKEVEDAGGKGLACAVDIRNEDQVRAAVEQTVKTFGGIDILINNASALNLSGIENIDMKSYDLVHNINTRGTYMVSKICLPYLKKSKHAHILNLSPPLNMDSYWFGIHLSYTMAKYGMSMCVLGLHEELRPFDIAVNALWPVTAIYTSAMKLIMSEDLIKNFTRKPEIMADAAYAVLIQEPKPTGQFFLDEEVLLKAGVSDLDHYANNPEFKDSLVSDFFVDAESATKFRSKLNAKL